MKKIESISEVHDLLLGIAKEFHLICTKHEIPYTMLGGTMLGAIRHKGFIPWDDDMDFAVPREHYDQLIEVLEKELSPEYRCLTYKNCEQIKYLFIKIEDSRTCIDDKSLNCNLEEKIGVNVDVFPLDQCNKNSWRIRRIMILRTLNTLFFVESPSYSKLKTLFKKTCMRFAPKDKHFFLKKLEWALLHAGRGDDMGNLIGRWRKKEIFKAEIYQQLTGYPFEDITLRGPQDYEAYLTQMYGNYMQLPPEASRQAHAVEGVYWRS